MELESLHKLHASLVVKYDYVILIKKHLIPSMVLVSLTTYSLHEAHMPQARLYSTPPSLIQLDSHFEKESYL